MALQRRHLQHVAALRRHRQEGRIGGAAVRPQGRQHDLLDIVETVERGQQGRVEHPALVAVGRRQEFIRESKAIEEFLEARVVVLAERRIFAERIAHHGQRLVQILAQDLGIRNALRDLAQPVHIVGKADQPCRPGAAGHGLESLAHHGRARHLAEGADVRQPRRPVAGLEDHRTIQTFVRLQRLVRLALLDQGQRLFLRRRVLDARFDKPRDQVAGLFERPGAAGIGERGRNGHVKVHKNRPKPLSPAPRCVNRHAVPRKTSPYGKAPS